MTLITFQDGRVVFGQPDKVGTEQACCCGKCAAPCPDYCCPESEGGGFPVPLAYYNGTTSFPTFSGNYCETFPGDPCPERNAKAVNVYDLVCDGTTYTIEITTCATISCSEIDSEHPTNPGCGRNCTVSDPVVTVTGDPFPPCYDEANIVFLYCPDPCP